MTTLIIAYVISVLIAAYLAARFIHPRLAGAAVLWPVFALISPLLIAAHYGDKHARAARLK